MCEFIVVVESADVIFALSRKEVETNLELTNSVGDELKCLACGLFGVVVHSDVANGVAVLDGVVDVVVASELEAAFKGVEDFGCLFACGAVVCDIFGAGGVDCALGLDVSVDFAAVQVQGRLIVDSVAKVACFLAFACNGDVCFVVADSGDEVVDAFMGDGGASSVGA